MAVGLGQRLALLLGEGGFKGSYALLEGVALDAHPHFLEDAAGGRGIRPVQLTAIGAAILAAHLGQDVPDIMQIDSTSSHKRLSPSEGAIWATNT
jgi:hypothetical protein